MTSPWKSTSSPRSSRRISSIISRMARGGFFRSMPSSAKPDTPAPMPSTARPPEISSRVAIAIAVSAGCRANGSVTQGPSATRLVLAAMTARQE